MKPTHTLSLAGPLLVVEDDTTHAQLMLLAASALAPGWPVMHCATGSQALDWLAQPHVSVGLALVDLGLPDVGGLEVVRALRRRFALAPVLVVSSVSAERSVLEAIRQGASGYLLKDSDAPTLVQGMRDALAGHSPISPALARYLFRLAGSPQGREAPAMVLTGKELETLQHLGRGHSYADTARLMGVELSTVQTHVRNLYRKLGVHSQTQAVLKAQDSGLL